MNLSDLKQGESGVIAKVRGRGAFRRRIMEMGFVSGKSVEVIKYAPLRDPVQYSIMGYEVSLRRDEAVLIDIFDIKNGDTNPVDVSKFHGTFSDKNEVLAYEKKPREMEVKVALVGNPNCGKTTIFNHVSGLHEKVGNYGGVTVDSKTTDFKYKNYKIDITDLPGTYSLTAYSPEELYVREFIINDMPDVVVNVLDASNLERNLYLTTQLIDMDIRVVIALNMSDELDKKGDKLDIVMISKLLGIPFVKTVGKKGGGVDELFDKVIEVFEDKEPVTRHIHINYGKEIERSISAIQSKIKVAENFHLTNIVSSRFLSLKLLEEDKQVDRLIEKCGNIDEIKSVVAAEVARISACCSDTAETVITDSKYGFIDGALKETLKTNSKFDRRRSSKVIDDIITNKLYSFPLFIFFMWVMFQATFVLGAYPQGWLELLVEFIGNQLHKVIPTGIIHDLVIDGIIGGVGGVIVFLPNILILFFFISIMEDTGYMARVAFIVDKIMHRVGLHGRSFIPLLMGFGCNVPAIMATRTIEGKNDRLVTMLITPFMSCSARLPVYILIISAFFPEHPGSMLFLVYSIGIAMAGIMAWVFKKTLMKAKEFPFVMELPPYRIPSHKTILKHMWFKAELYLKKMSGVIMIASLIIWALNYFPLNINYSKNYDEQMAGLRSQYSISSDTTLVYNKIHEIELAKQAERNEKSFIGQIGKFVEPAIAPLGFDWKMGVSLLSGMAAKEIVISTMGVLYQTDTDNGVSSLVSKIQKAEYSSGPRKGQPVYNKASAFAFLLFILFYFPCVAVISVVRRESGKWKWALFMVFYTTSLAWVFAFGAYQIGKLFL